MEQDVNRWFVVPWHDCRKAAACAIELARLVMPRLATPALTAPPESHGHPYRTAYCLAHDPNIDLLTAAARRVEYALQFAQSYVDGTIEEWAQADDDYDGSCVISWIYRMAGEYGEDAWQAGYSMLYNDPGWQVAGEVARTACVLVQKWAANSTGGGAVPNSFLERAVSSVLNRAAADYDTVSALACKWRFRDALGDSIVPTEELRLAFEAAWDIAEYAFAYQLFDPVEDAVVDHAEVSDI